MEGLEGGGGADDGVQVGAEGEAAKQVTLRVLQGHIQEDLCPAPISMSGQVE